VSQYESQFEENLYQLRRDKLAQIAALVRAANPSLSDIEAKYPNTFHFTHTLPELRSLGDPLDTEALEAQHIEAAIAGRLVAIRVQGKAGFATLQQSGQRLQIYVRKDDVGEDLFALYKLLDLGDHIGVRGYLMRTRTGELTLHASPITLPGDDLESAPETPALSEASEAPAVRVAPVRKARPAITFLAKAMLALPDKFHGLEDIELRYRRRYLDLFTDTGDTPEPTAPPATETTSPITEPGAPRLASETWVETPQPSTPDPADSKGHGFSPAIPPPQQPGAGSLRLQPEVSPEANLTRLPARDVFVKRAHILRSIRKFFDDRNYLEVETPMLHTISGGAAARPFETHHNALDIPLKLRIAPELYLKRLVVGGLDRVYEINRNFRNEGVSTQHNPEFTMLEFYQAYANYHDLMQLTQDLITQVAIDVNGTTITTFNDTEIDLSHWTKLSMREAIIKFWPEELGKKPSLDDFQMLDRFKSLLERAIRLSNERAYGDSNRTYVMKEGQLRVNNLSTSISRILWEVSNGTPLGKGIAEFFELVAEEHLIQPTIIYDFPLAISPLSKVKPDETDWVERFEFYIGGFEVGNAFSELNDPDDQQRRFQQQMAERKSGDAEAHEMDEDYVRALGYGMPPTAGEGIGIDRLTMILTGSRSIRDVILFPLMRPQITASIPHVAHEGLNESSSE
jgi:lysyl-tRNA synthetase class 2